VKHYAVKHTPLFKLTPFFFFFFSFFQVKKTLALSRTVQETTDELGKSVPVHSVPFGDELSINQLETLQAELKEVLDLKGTFSRRASVTASVMSSRRSSIALSDKEGLVDENLSKQNHLDTTSRDIIEDLVKELEDFEEVRLELAEVKEELGRYKDVDEAEKDIQMLMAGQLTEMVSANLKQRNEIKDLKNLLQEQYDLQNSTPLRWVSSREFRNSALGALGGETPMNPVPEEKKKLLEGRDVFQDLSKPLYMVIDPDYPEEAAPGALFMKMMENGGIDYITPAWEVEELKKQLMNAKREVGYLSKLAVVQAANFVERNKEKGGSDQKKEDEMMPNPNPNPNPNPRGSEEGRRDDAAHCHSSGR